MNVRRITAMTKPSISILTVFSLWMIVRLVFAQDLTSAQSDKTEETPPELQVMSFNIRYGTADDGHNSWKNRRHIVFDVIRDSHPDILCLQEDLRFQIEEIMQAVTGYGEVVITDNRGSHRGIHNSILYRSERFEVEEKGKFWFSDTPEVPGSIHWGNRISSACTWARLIEKSSDSAFYIYNIQLDRGSLTSRERSAVLLAQRITQRKSNDPFMVTGDFNSWENSTVVLYLKGEASLPSGTPENRVPMVDSFRVLHRDAEHTGTYNRFEGILDSPKVDYIMTSPDIRTLEAEIIRTNREGHYPSDHYPVTARLLLSPPPNY